jgi:hypothetical protein
MNQSFFALIAGLVCVACVSSPLAAQEREGWEIGVAGGYGFSRDVTIENAAGRASAGFKPGILFGVVAGNEVRPWLAGEVRYTYRQSDMKLSDGGTEARFDGESHAIHYDFVFQGGRRKSRGIRPFAAVGAGIRYFRGTGQESRLQALNRIAILTRTSDLRPLISVGGGVRIPVSSLLTIRIEARDYVSPFPREVIAPVPGSKTSGWLHDFAPMVGISFTF